MFPLDPGRQYHVTFTPPGARADHERRGLARDGHDAEDDGGAGVSDGGGRAREPAAALHPFLGADGQPRRARFRAPARRRGQGGEGSVPAARRRVLERRSHALHGVLRSGPPEARHRADRRDGALADGGQVVHAGRRRRVARRQRLAAEAAVSAAPSRSARRTRSRSIRRRGQIDAPAAGTQRTADGRRFPSRSITDCCCARSACSRRTASRSTARSSSAAAS